MCYSRSSQNKPNRTTKHRCNSGKRAKLRGMDLHSIPPLPQPICFPFGTELGSSHRLHNGLGEGRKAKRQRRNAKETKRSPLREIDPVSLTRCLRQAWSALEASCVACPAQVNRCGVVWKISHLPTRAIQLSFES